MKVLLHSRTADQFDWSHQTADLSRLPNVGEYIKVPAIEGDGQHYEVRMIVHVAGTGEIEAEVYCIKVGPTQIGRLGWKTTLARDPVPAEEPDNRPSVMMLTIAEAAKAANLSERTIYRLIKSGRLAAVACGTGKRKKNYRINAVALATVKPLEEPEPVPMPGVPTRRRRRRASPRSSSIIDWMTKY